MKPKVVVTHHIHDSVIDFLKEFCDPILNETTHTLSRAEILHRTRNAEGMMVFMPDSIDEKFLSQCPKLKVIVGALKGYDNFDVAACQRRGIWFTIIPDLLTIPTAELCIALALGVSRHILLGDTYIRSGHFQGWRPIFYGHSLYNSTAAIIGMGSLGKTLAQRLRAFEMQVLYFDRVRLQPEEETHLNVKFCSFQEVLSQADFVFPLVPMTSETFYMFNAETLEIMKRGSYLINCCRGSVIDENAVAASLQKGHLAGYAADVFEMEEWVRSNRPRHIPDSLLSQTEKTLFTPHLGSAVDNIRLEIEFAAACQLQQALAGKKPSYAVGI